MKELVTKQIANGDFSYELEVIEDAFVAKSLGLKLIIFSLFHIKVDVEFQYRTFSLPEWKKDAVLSNAKCDRVSNNVLIGVTASSDGSESSFMWNFAESAVAIGEICDVRLLITPQFDIFSYGDNSTHLERLSMDHVSDIVTNFDHVIVGNVGNGNYFAVSSNGLYILDGDKSLVLTLSPINNPVYAIQMESGNYLVLHDYGATISEYNENAVQLKTFSDAVHFIGAETFVFSENKETILISGGEKHFVIEVSWTNDNFGTVLWTYGNGISGSGDHQLVSPQDAKYDVENLAIIYIADTGNNRVLVINRNTDSVEIVKEVSVDDKRIAIRDPSKLLVTSDQIFVLEREQKTVKYTTNLCNHPSLLRYRARVLPPSSNDRNSVRRYNNIIFTPLLRTIE